MSEETHESNDADLLVWLQEEDAKMKVTPEAKAALVQARDGCLDRIVQERIEAAKVHALLRKEGAKMKVTPEAKAALAKARDESLERIVRERTKKE